MNTETLFSGLFVSGAVIGIGATIVMDIVAFILQKAFGMPSLNYALVGRWLVWLSRGEIFHDNIVLVKAVRAELAIGWLAHYLIGIIFGVMFIVVIGSHWLSSPNILWAIAFGVLTVGCPFFIMQPCMGLGVAAAKIPNPNLARVKSLFAHFVFGLGLYFSAALRLLF